jgi:DNA-directed RNA polymerase subunit RPC12/RpoP
MNQEQVIRQEEQQEAPLNCEYCSQKKAEIFQVTGYYCLHCWQEETHPNV